jgi:ADP-ribose pyrophosphatase YjhB (NUDIX family)
MFHERVALMLGPRLSFRLLRLWWWIWRPVLAGVRVLIIDDGQVMLVRHTYRRGWFLPGGILARGETCEDGARREAREETGLELHVLELLGVYTSLARNLTDHVMVFIARPGPTVGEPDHEIAEARWFPADNLPPGVDPSVPRRLAEFRRGARGLVDRW